MKMKNLLQNNRFTQLFGSTLMVMLVALVISQNASAFFGHGYYRTAVLRNVSNVNIDVMSIQPTGTSKFIELDLGSDNVFSDGEIGFAQLEKYDTTYTIHAGRSGSVDEIAVTVLYLENVEINEGDYFDIDWDKLIPVAPNGNTPPQEVVCTDWDVWCD